MPKAGSRNMSNCPCFNVFKGDLPMVMKYRVLLAVAVVLLDTLVFFLPLGAVFLAYIFIANPAWFRQFLERSIP
jgi:hypothetical protein